MGVMEQKKNRNLLLGQDGNALIGLIAVCAMVFVMLSFIKVGFLMSDLTMNAFIVKVQNWFVLPAELSTLLSRPWTIFTYMFTHDNVWHIVSNMLWLWAFGFILQDLAGNKHLAPIYLYGGWMGACMFLLSANIFPALQQQIQTIPPLVGAGASIMAVALATTTLAPNFRIFPLLGGGIPLWVLTLVFVLVDYALVASVHIGVAVSHIGGGLIGMLYTRALRRGSDWGEWMHSFYYWLTHMFDPKDSAADKHQQQKELHYQKGPEPFTKKTSVTQQRVDELLDKINNKGYHFLTEEEKEFLKRASQEDL
ncbi:MAG TPA: rhomboid family intramembrane serine protease [Phnomibacter sp.]|nr:rhomboid family intramembrane serine protease [Phnomibacter sp.]